MYEKMDDKSVAAELGLTHHEGCSVYPCIYVRSDGSYTTLMDELRKAGK